MERSTTHPQGLQDELAEPVAARARRPTPSFYGHTPSSACVGRNDWPRCRLNETQSVDVLMSRMICNTSLRRRSRQRPRLESATRRGQLGAGSAAGTPTEGEARRPCCSAYRGGSVGGSGRRLVVSKRFCESLLGLEKKCKLKWPKMQMKMHFLAYVFLHVESVPWIAVCT